MENLEITGKKDVYFVPSVKFDASTGQLLIQGESYLEDTRTFYLPLMHWINNFIKETRKPIHFKVDLSYYNTSSSKHLLELFYILKDYENDGGEVTVSWFYTEDDVDVEEEIEDLEIESGLKIKLVRKQ
jgi:hypothetical protein